MNRTKRSYFLPILILAFVYAGYVLFPLGRMVWESLHTDEVFTLENYVQALDPRSSANLEAVWNSVYVSVLSVVFSGVVGILFAFVFTQCDFPLRGVLSRVAVLPIALPPLVGVIAFLFVFGESGILPRVVEWLLGARASSVALEGLSAIVAIHTYSFSVYFYLFASTALRSLDASQLEAAGSFGASQGRIFRQIVLPELKPAIIGASVLTFMTSMASFSAPLLFGGDKRFMTLQIYNAKLNGEIGLAATYAVGLTIISLLFFVLLRTVGHSSEKRSMKGATRSGRIRISPGLRRLLIASSLLIMAIEILPILTIVLISFAKEGAWTWQIIPHQYTMENYGKLLSDPRVFEPIINSTLMSVITVAAAVVVGVAVAYLLTKGNLGRWRTTGETLAALPFAIPGTVIAIALILAFNMPSIFSAFNVLVGTFWILPLAYFVRMFPMVVRSTSASLEHVDSSLMEAGETFGAGLWTRFRKILLPLIAPGIVSGALLVMITALGEFVSSVLLYSYANRPIAVEILAQMRTYNFGAAAAYSVFLLVFILALVALANAISRERTLTTPEL
ncbi:MAG: iron ABC transporter permease [Ignavibacteriae bacterium]|nr:iron ABC transporter permease [Ignavibacteriota bacterium]